MSAKINRLTDIGPFIPEEDDDLIICRCEEVTKGEIRRAIHDGMWTLTEIKRYIRPGMGLCQGQTCGRLVKNIVAKELETTPSSLKEVTARTPNRPVELSIYRKGMMHYE
ncbi:MAG: (2Fe-2S)-binding protein [Lachnospiraceae bacterium]|nr:(2Fe-2S)-binding protein [Lachnospiraceae bacterium]